MEAIIRDKQNQIALLSLIFVKSIFPHFGSQPFSKEMLGFADPHRCGGAVIG